MPGRTSPEREASCPSPSPLLARLPLLLALGLGLGLGACDARSSARERPTSARDGSRETGAGPRRNLLFIMTDQQRWDTIAHGGNQHIATPNLDRLAREGAYFANAYSASPVCVPARAVILTGNTVETVGVRQNADYTREYDSVAGADVPTFDNILSHDGYYTEYWGKWHTPLKYTLTYDNKVRPSIGKPTPTSPLQSESDAFKAFLAKNGAVVTAPAVPGDNLDQFGRSYKPIALDSRAVDGTEASTYGMLRAPAELSRTAFTAGEAIEALDRAKQSGKPFSVTCSLGPPHPPTVVSEPYYGMYPNLPVPASISDPMSDSPYRTRWSKPGEAPFRDPANVRQFKQIYYGMIAETDVWVGKLLQKLDDLGLAQSTLVVFVSDHGEMLGDHGLHSKNIFLEGSAHVPLIMRLPGAIPAGRRVVEPVGHYDISPTILDYLGVPGPVVDGTSLRELVDGKADPERIAISEWTADTGPTLMVRSSTHKLITSHRPNDPGSDALYDVSADPDEMVNLLAAGSADRAAAVSMANALKAKAEAFFVRIGSPRLDGLRQHAIR